MSDRSDSPGPLRVLLANAFGQENTYAIEPFDYEHVKESKRSPLKGSLPLETKSSSQLQALDERRRIGFSTLLPTLGVFIVSSGLGIAMFAWLCVKCEIPVSEALRVGYLLVDEGTKHADGGLESATLRALTAASFISTAVLVVSPILLSLIGYHIAHLWIVEQDNPSSPTAKTGPTPLQYGIMLEALHASSILSFGNAIRYLWRGKQHRASAPSYFLIAIWLGVAVYVVTHLIGLGDIWLHATTTAVLYNLTSTNPESEPPKAAFAFNETYCDSKHDFEICLSELDGWGISFPKLVGLGESVVSNSSSDRRVTTLADADDTAIVIPLAVDPLAKFKVTTFGMRASCESLNGKCLDATNCSSIGITDIPVGNSGGSVVFIKDSHTERTQLTVNQVSNPVQSLLQIRWSTQGTIGIDVPNDAVSETEIPQLTILASCNIHVLNVTATFDGTLGDKAWALVSEETVLADGHFATILIAPYSWQLVSDRLTSNIKARAMLSNSSDEVISALNQELGRLALGQVVLGRYPLVPLLTFIGLLLLYGLVALWIFMLTFTATSDLIHVPRQLRGKPNDKAVPEIRLAQTRLLSPMPTIAQLFLEGRSHTPGASDSDALSAKTYDLDMFDESETNSGREIRLRIGLEGCRTRPRYGLWKQTSRGGSRLE